MKLEDWIRENDKFLDELVDILNVNFSACNKNNKTRQREIKSLRKSLTWLAIDVALLGVMNVLNKVKIDKIEARLEGKNDGI